MVPRRTRSFTSFTATNPRNSLVSASVSRMTSSAISGAGGGRRVEPRLALLVPRSVGLVHLPRRHALVLGPQHVLQQRARVAMKRLVQEALGVSGGGRRGAAPLRDDRGQRGVEVGGRAHTVDHALRAALPAGLVVRHPREPTVGSN